MMADAHRHLDKNGLFSVRETLLGPGEPRERFHRCLVEAKRFIDTTSVAGILDLVFEGEENRRSVRGSVRDILHVGFIIPDEALTIADMSRASNEAGFCSGHATFPSAVIARELGELVGCPQIPTTIFTANAEQMHGRSRYVEALIPIEEKKLVKKWIEEEVGTHIGLTLASPSAFTTVQDAFQTEGFRIPPFMHGKPITNFDKGVTVTYYEKCHGEGKVRIEVLLSLGGASR
jgi:hypothetical protein